MFNVARPYGHADIDTGICVLGKLTMKWKWYCQFYDFYQN